MALLVLAGGLAPSPARACMCVAPDPETLGRFVAPPGTIVFTGTVGRPAMESTPVAVDGWFKGDRSAIVRLETGVRAVGRNQVAATDCGFVPGPPGSRWLFVADRPAEAGAPYRISACSIHERLETADGARLLQRMTALLGPPVPPGPRFFPPEASSPPPPAAPGVPDARLGVLAAGLVLVVVGAVFALKRRPSI